ncbi:MAG: YbjN domain-containing protein [Sandaracinaceae bacterium]|nr:YbjN domain-containing protein [Sandaracinaceae bacterium]
MLAAHLGVSMMARWDADLATAVQLIEGAIRAMGLNPSFTRQPTGGSVILRHMLQRGSANVYVSLHRPIRDDEEGILRVLSPIARLSPAMKAREAELFRRLLELNGSEILGAAFALVEGEIAVIAERSVQDLDASEVEAMLRVVGTVADDHDDSLSQEFGVTCIRDTRI